MATELTLESYLKNNSSVKAARKKLDASEKKLNAAKKALASSRNASADVVADINNSIKEARNAYNEAKSAASSVENAASEYFKTNYQSMSKKSAQGSLSELEAALPKAKTQQEYQAIQEAIANAKSTIANPKPYTEPSKKGAKPSTGTAAEGAGEVGVDTAATIDSANKALAAMAATKDATNFINKMDDTQRLALAKKLNDANYNAPLTGKYNRGLVEAYVSALSDAQSENTFNKDVKGFSPFGLDSYLTYRTDLVGASGGAGVGAPQSTVYNLSPTDAAVVVNNVFTRELNRNATQEEIKALLPAIKAFSASTPGVRGTSSQTSAGNVEEYVRQLVAGEAKVKGKKISSLVDTLSKEYGTKKSDKTNVVLEDIRKTALNNGYKLSETQLADYASRIKNGESADTIKKSIRGIISNAYASNKGVQDLLAAGNDLADIYQPYRTTMASILEVPYDKIDINDPTLAQAIGSQGNMPLYEYKNLLRKDPRWQYTDNARDAVSSGLSQVLRDFGFMG